MATNYLDPEMNYKLALLEIITSVKTNTTDGQEGERRRTAFLERFSEKFESIPSNTMEANQDFFSAMYDDMLAELSDYYSIQSENKVVDGEFNRTYRLTQNDNITEIQNTIEKYGASVRFMDGFLRDKDRELYLLIGKAKTNLRDMSSMGVISQYNDVKVLSPFYIPNNVPIFTPICRRTYSIGNFFALLENHKKLLDSLVSKHESFLGHVESYKQEIKENVIREHIRFGATYLKEILSRIIIPVSCLEDEKLKQACKEQGREVFVRKPEIKDFLFPGARVHIYSSHDLEDDSSYVIKPVTVEPTIPADTEDLKYHGIGLYSYYDDASKRSCEGATPHVIGGVLYCGAGLDEFYQVIPEALLEEIRICEKLVESMDEEVGFEYMGEGLAPIIQKIKEDTSTDVSDITQKFLSLEKLTKDSSFTEEQERALNDTNFLKPNYVFNECLMITTYSEQPYGFCIFKDSSGTYAAVKRDSDNNKQHKVIKKQIFGELGFIAACKTLGLPSGVYPIFDFGKRTESREKAIISMARYTKSE